MKDATTLDTPTSSTFTELNIKQDKGKPHFVRLHDSVVRDLERQLAGGKEQAGVLFGSISGTDSCTIAVDGFEAAAKIDDRVRAGGSRKIVGLYRSHPRPDFTLEASDRALFQRCFAKDARLLLLAKPPKTGVGTAIFLLGENGQLAIERATVEFPFNLRELGAEESPAPPPVVAAPVVGAAKAPSNGGKIWKIGAAGVAVIASVVGLNGLRVFDGQKPPIAQQPVAAIAERAPAPPVVEPAVVKPNVVEPPAPTVVAKAAKATAAPKPPVPAPVPEKAAVKTPLVATARVETPTNRAVEIPSAQSPAVNENPAPVAQPRTPVKAPPAPAAAAPAVQAAAPASPNVAEPVIPTTPPRATRQFAPTVSDKTRRSITGEVVVKVKVNVDATGKVIAAESLAGGDPVADALAGSAISAVKKWQFEPARRGDQKVAGEIVLSFTFRK